MSYAPQGLVESSTRRDTQPGQGLAANRRQTERYAVAEDQAWLGWWEGRLYRRSTAALVDISQGGVKLLAEFAPPRRSTVWVCIDGPHRTEWVEGAVVDVTRAPNGMSQVRLAFREVCPYAFFEVAVYGFPSMIEAPAAPKAASAADPAGRNWW